MITYLWRCRSCKVDWRKQFRITEKPDHVVCPECKSVCLTVIPPRGYQGSGIIFTDAGFPSNDMKGLHTGVSNMPGRKPTHKELDIVEAEMPDANVSKSLEHGDM